MPKLLLVPECGPQTAKVITHDEVCTRILPNIPEYGTVCIAICQDGRGEIGQRPLQTEFQYFIDLFQSPKYLDRSDVTVKTFGFTFLGDEATMQQSLVQLEQVDIFVMTGFENFNRMPEKVKEVFRNHARCGDDESQNLSDIREQCYKRIESRVLYNLMVYMGVLEGALCAGKHSWIRLESGGLGHHLIPPIAGCHNEDLNLKLFDFCMGINIDYASQSVNECIDMLPFISPPHLMITRGAGLAVHIQDSICESSSFDCSTGSDWYEWCLYATQRHRDLIQCHAKTARTGPYYHPTVESESDGGLWWLGLNGKALLRLRQDAMVVVKMRNHEESIW